jgi:hypothetical protein
MICLYRVETQEAVNSLHAIAPKCVLNPHRRSYGEVILDKWVPHLSALQKRSFNELRLFVIPKPWIWISIDKLHPFPLWYSNALLRSISTGSTPLVFFFAMLPLQNTKQSTTKSLHKAKCRNYNLTGFWQKAIWTILQRQLVASDRNEIRSVSWADFHVTKMSGDVQCIRTYHVHCRVVLSKT